jgi:hypothetical protein
LSDPIVSLATTFQVQRAADRAFYQKSGAVLQPYGVSRRWLVVKRRFVPQDDLSIAH